MNNELANRFLSLVLVALTLLAPACLPEEDGEPPPEVTLQGEEDMGEEGGNNASFEDMAAADMGGDSEEDMPSSPGGEEEFEPRCDGAPFGGTLYLDTNASSSSLYYQPIDEEDERLGAREVWLRGADLSWKTSSCEDGAFGFDAPPNGAYLLDVERDEGWISTSSSHGASFQRAVARGEVKVVAFGDSIPAYGPTPWFPERFGRIVSALAEVEVVNVAAPGSRSYEWLPGTSFYDSRLKPHIADADVLVFSLGGNDLYAFANADLSAANIQETYDEFELLVEEIKDNIRAIVSDVRAQNPDVDIVWLLYPNYASTDQWAALAGDVISIVDRLLKRTLVNIREDLAHHEGLLLWDIFGATLELDLDGYLIDPLHLNERGHELYARELFKVLGGVLVEDDQIDGPTRDLGFAPAE